MQTSQSQNLTEAIPGMLFGRINGKSDILGERVAEAAILCGLFVCLGTDTANQCKLPASAGNVTSGLLGVAMYDASKPTAAGVSAAQYEIGETVSIVHVGYVWAFSEEAMALTDGVYIRITASGGNTVLGKVRNDADTATATLATGIRVVKACAAAGPVLLEILVPFTS